MCVPKTSSSQAKGCCRATGLATPIAPEMPTSHEPCPYCRHQRRPVSRLRVARELHIDARPQPRRPRTPAGQAAPIGGARGRLASSSAAGAPGWAEAVCNTVARAPRVQHPATNTRVATRWWGRRPVRGRLPPLTCSHRSSRPMLGACQGLLICKGPQSCVISARPVGRRDAGLGWPATRHGLVRGSRL
jgi:hypothetical protein